MAFRKERCSTNVWNVYVYLVRWWGLMTALILWGISVETVVRGYVLGWFLIGTAVITTFLETTHWINKFVILCKRDNMKSFISIWELVMWIDDWKKGIVYLLLSVQCFVEMNVTWLPVISGCMLVLCGLMYTFKSFRWREDLLDERAEDESYNRFAVPDEDLDDISCGNQSMTPIYSAIDDMDDNIEGQANILQV